MRPGRIPLTFWAWLPFGWALTWICAGGLETLHFPPVVSWPLGFGIAFSGWYFLVRLRQTGQVEFLIFGLLAIAFGTACEGVNLMNRVKEWNAKPAAVAKAKSEGAFLAIENAGAAVKDAEAAVAAAELAWTARRQDAETEKGRGGPGTRWDAVTKEAAALGLEAQARRAELAARRDELTRVLVTAAESKVQAVDVEEGQHVLARLPWWALFLACLVLEVVAAAIGYCEPVEKAGIRREGGDRTCEHSAQVGALPALALPPPPVMAPAPIVHAVEQSPERAVPMMVDPRLENDADLERELARMLQGMPEGDVVDLSRFHGRLAARLYRELGRRRAAAE